MKYLHCIVLTVSLLLSIGCVKMRDYTGVHSGAFGLNVNQRFGQGDERKDYYAVDEQIALSVGDTKNEVRSILGSPDAISTTLEGYECWCYRERDVEFLFSGGRLKNWRKPAQ